MVYGVFLHAEACLTLCHTIFAALLLEIAFSL